MIFFFLLLMLCMFYRMQYSKFNEQYLSRDTTNAIKGLFVMLVFLSHSIGYIQLDNTADTLYVIVRRYLGQLIVCMFLFYSGYGVFESIKNKKDYMKTFLKNRLFKTWLHFALAVICFILVDCFLGYTFQTKTYILSFIGWESVNNSNWFVFCILYLYVATYIACKITKSLKTSWCIVLLFTIGYVLLTHHFKDSWWWDTSVCYPLGMLFSIYKAPIEKCAKECLVGMRYFIVVLVLFVLLCTTYMDQGIYASLAKAIFFTLLIVVLTMKFNVRNSILCYFGVNTFNIFILQRIPMMILAKNETGMNKYVFILICFIVTLVLSELFNIIIKRIDKCFK